VSLFITALGVGVTTAAPVTAAFPAPRKTPSPKPAVAAAVSGRAMCLAASEGREEATGRAELTSFAIDATAVEAEATAAETVGLDSKKLKMDCPKASASATAEDTPSSSSVLIYENEATSAGLLAVNASFHAAGDVDPERETITAPLGESAAASELSL
jgi:hypothetical protein